MKGFDASHFADLPVCNGSSGGASVVSSDIIEECSGDDVVARA